MCGIQAPCSIPWAFFFGTFLFGTYLSMLTLHMDPPSRRIFAHFQFHTIPAGMLRDKLPSGFPVHVLFGFCLYSMFFPPLLHSPVFFIVAKQKVEKFTTLLQLQYSSMCLTNKFLNSAYLVFGHLFLQFLCKCYNSRVLFSGSAPCWDCL
jgi:hypothetical protein